MWHGCGLLERWRRTSFPIRNIADGPLPRVREAHMITRKWIHGCAPGSPGNRALSCGAHLKLHNVITRRAKLEGKV